jgi:hypothetical protein
MPSDDLHLQRLHSEASAICSQNAFMRDIVARSREILKQAVPDTFLGRKTFEPFPREISSAPDSDR